MIIKTVESRFKIWIVIQIEASRLKNQRYQRKTQNPAFFGDLIKDRRLRQELITPPHFQA